MAAKKRQVRRVEDDGSLEDLSAKDYDRQIAEYRRKIRTLEAEKAAAEFAKTELCKNLQATQEALAKAMSDMDGRAQVLSAAFVRASRQYLALLERQIEEGLGKRRRGRKPKSDLGMS